MHALYYETNSKNYVPHILKRGSIKGVVGGGDGGGGTYRNNLPFTSLKTSNKKGEKNYPRNKLTSNKIYYYHNNFLRWTHSLHCLRLSLIVSVGPIWL